MQEKIYYNNVKITVLIKRWVLRSRRCLANLQSSRADCFNRYPGIRLFTPRKDNAWKHGTTKQSKTLVSAPAYRNNVKVNSA